MDNVNVVGLILFFGGCLAVIFVFRLIRVSRAKRIFNASESNVKLYLAGSNKTISDGIEVFQADGKKPVIGRDQKGNYVVLSQGSHSISVGFIALKDFAPAAAAPGLAPVIINSKKKKEVIRCTVKPGRSYMLDFDRDNQAFTIEELQV